MYKWQAQIGPVEGVDAPPPPGWEPADGPNGAWTPVGVLGGGVLWRRLLTAQAKRQAALVDAQPQPQGSGLPAWARRVRAPDASPQEVARAVTRAVDAICWPDCDRDGRSRWPLRRGEYAAKADAQQVIALWKGRDYPPLEEFLADLELVARAARECNDPLFARDIRGKGWSGGVDRSRSVATLTVQTRWTERVQAARKWLRSRGGNPDPAPAEPEDSGPLPSLRGSK